MREASSDQTKTWVFGKAQPGWYVARWIWNGEYARHLESIGYKVERSVERPSS